MWGGELGTSAGMTSFGLFTTRRSCGLHRFTTHRFEYRTRTSVGEMKYHARSRLLLLLYSFSQRKRRFHNAISCGTCTALNGLCA